MNIPEHIKIGGMEYRIKLKENTMHADNKNRLMGTIDHMKHVIKLSTKQDADEMQATLLHEVIHAIFQQAGMELGDKTESVCNCVSYGLRQVLTDNEKSLFGTAEK